MLYWLLSILAGILLAVPGARETSLLHLLPYSSLQFFVFLIPVFVVIGLLRSKFKSDAAWIIFLQLINLAFLVFLYPSPLPLVFCAFWLYAVLQWRKSSRKHSFIQGLLLLLPLILKAKTSEIQFLGLSYATFRAFHLFMDFELLADLGFRRFFFFVFYFPALLAGPIDRWPRFKAALAQSRGGPAFQPEAFYLLALGLVQKFILGEAVHRYLLPQSLVSKTDWVCSFYGYPLYLYLDFAGYSAMAMGFSLLIGLSLPRNFDKPFLARNPQEFWQRFHITLGEWLRDYFFKPIYRASHRWPWIKQSPLARQNVALFLTFLLMGLWNGTHKQFIISGALFGLYSMIHNTFRFRYKSAAQATSPLAVWVSRFIMIHAAALALFIFSGIPFKG